MSESATSQPALPFEEPERWLPVGGWEGFYEVSGLGRVRSLPRQTRRGVRGGKILKPWLNPGGYQMVGLSRDGQSTDYLVHQLVAAAHIGPCPEGEEVRHGPNGKLDNRASQLCYGTRSENVKDRTRDGQDNRGERSGLAKLTWAAVADIRSRVAAGEYQCNIAREYRVSKQAVCLVIARKTWVHPPS